MSKIYLNTRVSLRIFRRAAGCLAAFFILSVAASAATYTVDTTVDNAALNVCSAAPNDCSLRGALGAANGTASADTIDFALPASSTITLTAGVLSITTAVTAGPLTITNPTGSANVVISGGNATRVFALLANSNLTLNGVTVTMGNGGGPGGGINVGGDATLILTNSVVSNSTSINNGGGIYCSTGSLTSITNSTVSGNSAPQGGGIYNANTSTVSITNSTISGNAASTFGGGIVNNSNSTLTLTQSTVSGNNAPDGGGIYNLTNGTTTLINSTVSGNTATSNGGGIANDGTLNLTSVTVAFNTASTSGGGVRTNFGTSNVSNTIIGKNTAPSASDLSGSITSGSFNLIGSATDPLLNPTLSGNFGTTRTHALLAGSPAIDMGNAAGTDQRGLTRPFDNPGVPDAAGGNGADIGAFEAQAVAYMVDTTADNAALTTCSSAPNDCSLRGAIAASNATIDNDTIGFALPAGVNTITLTGGQLAIGSAASAGTLTITNSTGAANLLISGGNVTRVFVLNDSANLTVNAVTITNGNTDRGGGIYCLTNTTLAVTNSTISGNTATIFGGGISTQNGTFSVTNSTISGNTGPSFGGGIFNNNGTFTLTNSTVSGNTSSQSGGGIYSNLTLNLNSVTVAFNNNGTGGGGVYNEPGGTVNLTNTIIANNSGPEPDFSGGISSGSSFNLIGDGSGMSGITGGADGNQVGIDPNLSPTLAFNSGTTRTHAFLATSPAIDKGLSVGLVTDQRGLTRPSDSPAIVNAAGGNGADVGAFEVQFAPTAASVSISGSVRTPGGNGLSKAVVTLSDAHGNARTARSSSFGYFRFEGVVVGETYIVTVSSKRYSFAPLAISLTEEITEMVLMPESREQMISIGID